MYNYALGIRYTSTNIIFTAGVRVLFASVYETISSPYCTLAFRRTASTHQHTQHARQSPHRELLLFTINFRYGLHDSNALAPVPYPSQPYTVINFHTATYDFDCEFSRWLDSLLFKNDTIMTVTPEPRFTFSSFILHGGVEKLYVTVWKSKVHICPIRVSGQIIFKTILQRFHNKWITRKSNFGY